MVSEVVHPEARKTVSVFGVGRGALVRRTHGIGRVLRGGCPRGSSRGSPVRVSRKGCQVRLQTLHCTFFVFFFGLEDLLLLGTLASFRFIVRRR